MRGPSVSREARNNSGRRRASPLISTEEGGSPYDLRKTSPRNTVKAGQVTCSRKEITKRK